MHTITAISYNDKQHRAVWEQLVARSKNGTFLHTRAFLDYHGDKFADRSILLLKNGVPFACMPAHHNGSNVCSHRGLSYGGVLWPLRTGHEDAMDAWRAIVHHYQDAGFNTLDYRPVPSFYHRAVCHEDAYPLYALSAKLVRVATHSAIDLHLPLRLQHRRVRGMKTALRHGIRMVSASDRWNEFWPMLEQRLRERAHVRPVHTLDEIKWLAARFPEQIQLWLAESPIDNNAVAGIVFFIHAQAVNAQYIASNAQGRECRALDLLMGSALEAFAEEKQWMGLGTSHWPQTHQVNAKLKEWKESWGALEYAQYFWEVPLADY